MFGHQLARKIAFKKTICMPAIGNSYRSRVVVFRNTNVTGTDLNHKIVNLVQIIWAHVDQNPLDEDEGALSRGSEVQNRGMMDFDESVALKFGGSF